jgi:hypothetical protein
MGSYPADLHIPWKVQIHLEMVFVADECGRAESVCRLVFETSFLWWLHEPADFRFCMASGMILSGLEAEHDCLIKPGVAGRFSLAG